MRVTEENQNAEGKNMARRYYSTRGRRNPVRGSNTTTIAKEALERAVNGNSPANDAIVIGAFTKRGLPLCEIKPRVNVFTYFAWIAKGRQVKKGEKAVRVNVVIDLPAELDENGKVTRLAHPVRRTACVFHVSQTKEANSKSTQLQSEEKQDSTKSLTGKQTKKLLEDWAYTGDETDDDDEASDHEGKRIDKAMDRDEREEQADTRRAAKDKKERAEVLERVTQKRDLDTLFDELTS